MCSGKKVLPTDMFGYAQNHCVVEKIHYDQEFLQVDRLSRW